MVMETVTEQWIAAVRHRTTVKIISREIGDLPGRSWSFWKERSDLRTDGHNVATYWDAKGEG